MIHASQFKSMSLFAGVDGGVLAKVAASVAVQRVPRGRILIQKGDTSSDVFLVLSGALVGILISQDGKEVAYATINSGSCVGEMAALDGGPRSLTVQAADECLIGRVPADVFLGWLEDHPPIARNLLTDFVARTRGLNDRVYELVVHDLETRVRLLLVRLAIEADALRNGGTLDPAPSHNTIAAHVGANREAVSRVISRMGKAGILGSGRQRIAILDADALVDGL